MHRAQAIMDPGALAEDGGVASSAAAQRCLSALLAITPPAVEGASPLSAPLAARWLLAAHHPALAHAGGMPRSAWAAVRRRGGSMAAALAKAPDAAVSVLMGPEGVASEHPAEERAAHTALGSAMAENAPALFDCMLAALQTLLDRREPDAMSPDEVKIFQTPPGMPLAPMAGRGALTCSLA